MAKKVRYDFENDLKLRGCRPTTRANYVRCCERLFRHCKAAPTQVGKEQIRAFLVHLVNEEEVSPSTYNVYAAAMKALYTETLGRPEEVAWIKPMKVRHSVPTILSGAEVEGIMDHLESDRMRAVILAAYGAGLRVGEACALRFDQIDRERMVIRVRGKGDKERYTMLPLCLLETLELYWRKERPKGPEFFPGIKRGSVLGRDAVAKALSVAAKKAKIRKKVNPHVLRHSFATHLIEEGTDIRVVQVLLGHASIRTTMRYVQVSKAQIAKTKSPADRLRKTKPTAEKTRSKVRSRKTATGAGSRLKRAS